MWTTGFDLASRGYVAEEYFLSGSAQSFRHMVEPADDGEWVVEPIESENYMTRFVVYRPADMTCFSGTVHIEWLNVSGGLDAAPGWLYAHRQFMRSGDAWAGVSAQKAGIDGGAVDVGLHLKAADPDRYSRLQHPGDAYSFDIFTQVIEAIRGRSGVLAQGKAGPLLAMGSSQSAMALVTYVNAIDPHVTGIDGYLIHGRGAEAMPLDGRFIPWEYGENRTGRHRIRNTPRVPVLTLQSETDVVLLGGGRARQADTGTFRLWEVAGAAHFDTYGLHASLYDDGNRSPGELAALVAAVGRTQAASGLAYSRGWQMHYVLQSAIAHLADWAILEMPLPLAHWLESSDADASRLQVDDHGLVRGGVRSPWVDVPTAIHSGLRGNAGGAPYDLLFGKSVPFEPHVLEDLYPRGRTEYLDRYTTALEGAVSSGFILAADQEEIMAVADVEWPGLS